MVLSADELIVESNGAAGIQYFRTANHATGKLDFGEMMVPLQKLSVNYDH